MCLAAGMDAYLSKPIDAVKLIKLVESAKRRPDAHQSSDTWEGPSVTLPRVDTLPLFNLQAARARMDDNEQLVRDLAAFFLEDAPRLAREIQHAVQKNDAESLERAAHSLKGLAANFDAEPLIMLAISTENSARDGDIQSAQENLPELTRTVERICAEFQKYLGRKG
jgi:HPt (histidine-containing phosphotransfer) domain-containing protein